jgi:hypothetical protein
MINTLLEKFTLIRGIPYVYNLVLLYIVFFLEDNHNEQQYFNNLASIGIIISVVIEGLINEFVFIRRYVHNLFKHVLFILIFLILYIFSLSYVGLFSSIVLMLILCTGNAIFLRINILSNSNLIYISAFGRIFILLLIYLLIKLEINFSMICFLSISLPLLVNTVLLQLDSIYKEYELRYEKEENNYFYLIPYLAVNVINGLILPNANPIEVNLLQSRINSMFINNCYTFFRLDKNLILNFSLLLIIIINILLLIYFSAFNIYFFCSIFSSVFFILILRLFKKSE